MPSAVKPYFNEAGLAFLRSLKRNNDREWFNARKPIYEAEVKEPMLALIQAINEELTGFAPEFVRDPAKCMFRIYRDTRFSKDKVPYKDHAAAWWVRQGLGKTSGAGFYFELNPIQITVAAGCYMPEREQLLAIRRHLLGRHEEFRKLAGAKKLKALGMTAFEPARTTRPPKGFPADHPAIDLIAQRQWGLAARLPAELALGPGLAGEVVDRFRAAAPLVALLNEPLIPAPNASLW
jgi:uncharacterized protein (TIGR02453 family)